MNSTKLFNTNYLKENLKKSKGIIILFLVLVPVFTAIVTIFSLNEQYQLNVVDKIDVMWVNLIGMYIVPIVLSFSLFGYIYKKASVDFINSMPINRKSIFVTNSIGGIILITLMQIITSLILIICDACLPNLIIFPNLVTDMFLIMWVSYVFVFLATNVAMSFSGTFLTQIAVTMLILFLVPFCMDGYNGFGIRTVYQMANIEDYTISINAVESQKEYTMPYRIIHMIINGTINTYDMYSINSILRMVVLGIIYFFVGMLLFQKRKMENTEESFANIKMHLFVKALTIIPMIIFLNLINAGLEFNIFAVALIVVYYFIFDFALKRKISLKVSIPILIITLVTLQGICSGVNVIKENLPKKNIEREDIIAVSLPIFENGSYYYYSNGSILDEDIFIENEEVIDLLYNSNVELKKELLKRAEEEKKGGNIDAGLNYTYVNLNLKMKSGEILRTNIDVFKEDYEKVLEILEKDTEYVNNIKNSFIDNEVLSIENIICSEEEKSMILSEIGNVVKDLSLKEIYDSHQLANCDIYLYNYENHTLVKRTIPIDISEKVFEISTTKINQNTKEMILKSIEDDLYYGGFHLRESINSDVEYAYADISNKIPDFIIKYADEKVDMSKPYCILSGNTMGVYYSSYFYTNRVEEVKAIYGKEEERTFYKDYED